jgi:hypothetical protein
MQVVDVDDAREAADAVEEQRQVVVGALQRDLDRPLAVEVLVGEVAGSDAQDVEVALLGERAQAAQQVLGVETRRQDAQQLVELELQPPHLLAELRQALLGGAPLLDLPCSSESLASWAAIWSFMGP